jgi:FtsH-binding integral membrane protein
MTDVERVKYLRFALLLVGLIFLFGVYPLTIVWPSGWAWHTGQSEYLQMILAIYATLGIFLMRASRDPLAHRSLIWFVVWSSVVHGMVMAVQAVVYSQHIGHLAGDVAALFVVAAVLAFLVPRGGASEVRRAA